MKTDKQEIIDQRVAEINKSTDSAYIIEVLRQTKTECSKGMFVNSQFNIVAQAVDKRIKELGYKQDVEERVNPKDVEALNRCFAHDIDEPDHNSNR